MATCEKRPGVPPPPPDLYILTLSHDEALDLRGLTGASAGLPDTLYAIHRALTASIGAAPDPATFAYGEYAITRRRS